MEVFGAKGR